MAWYLAVTRGQGLGPELRERLGHKGVLSAQGKWSARELHFYGHPTPRSNNAESHWGNLHGLHVVRLCWDQRAPDIPRGDRGVDTGDKDKLGQVVPGGGARGRRFLPSPILQEANPVVCEALADGGRFFFGSVKKQQCKRHRAADFIRNLVGWTAASPTGCAPPLGPTPSEGRRGTIFQALGHPDPSDLCDLVLVFGSSLRPWSSLRRWYSDRLVTAGASAARMASWLAHHCCGHASSHPLHGHLTC